MKKTTLAMWAILFVVIPIATPGTMLLAKALGVESRWVLVSIVAVVLAALGFLAARMGKSDKAWGVGVSPVFSLAFGAVLLASLAVPPFLMGDAFWGTAFLAAGTAMGALALVTAQRRKA